MIRVDALWLSTTPLDMQAGTETILARVVSMFGEARPHHAYLFANRRANRLKVLIHDGYGIWLAHRRLNQRRFHWRLSVVTEFDVPMFTYGDGLVAARDAFSPRGTELVRGHPPRPGLYG